MKKIKSNKKTKEEYNDFYIKANRKVQRDAELEGSFGWSSKTRVHKTKKLYNRKKKSREEDDSDPFFSLDSLAL